MNGRTTTPGVSTGQNHSGVGEGCVGEGGVGEGGVGEGGVGEGCVSEGCVGECSASGRITAEDGMAAAILAGPDVSSTSMTRARERSIHSS